ncbi:thioredoxin family protein [Staphylococcus saccharolyticus]|uniref:thioredoxin family protein n=1 Tax=Staphylococcus saccharolyticus TaxID=33028 RepID=UPI00102E0EC3|nr:thioredoxin family protein [Staphylococcus saccharolyticus]MBL7572789.1 thioredoxin family protein [Staphylococcus saccharolyticus]MBL7584275.1 thioredoxin family protein [Staphylococcus saccharolyticus]MBL7638406.1 thioredoxin family protein [Staphylococcus saccharolyticus]QRJ68089.1 thioredoxin family protein [Staphylococcus saccharolyticus]TAA93327.1 thiol reductase thioredoxin [Staphylococcus saccharolyticus]
MQNIHKTEEFDSIINSQEPVIVKFEADWCPDCKAMDMWITQIVEKFNNYNWYVVDRDELEETITKNNVMGIPSILIFKNGKKLAHLHSANAKTPDQVESFLDENLN